MIFSPLTYFVWNISASNIREPSRQYCYIIIQTKVLTQEMDKLETSVYESWKFAQSRKLSLC